MKKNLRNCISLFAYHFGFNQVDYSVNNYNTANIFHVIFAVNTCVSISPCRLHAIIGVIACIQGMQVQIYSICPLPVLPVDDEVFVPLGFTIFYSNDYK